MERVRLGRHATNLRDTEVGENQTPEAGRTPYEKHLCGKVGVAGSRVYEERRCMG
jgi:hypothetical protein